MNAPLAALLLGVFAVIVPSVYLVAMLVLKSVLGLRDRASAVVLASCLLGMGSLCSVVASLNEFAVKGDSSGFFDTIDAFFFCSVTLLVLVGIVNTTLLAARSFGGADSRSRDSKA